MPKINEELFNENSNSNDQISTPKKGFKPKNYRAWKTDISKESINTDTTMLDQSDRIIKISPNDIHKWEFKDRPENELGDIEGLAKDLVNNGQQQPCIVRPISNDKYELIIGERRWHAAKQANILLEVIIRDYSDTQAALAQATENDNREDLSDFAKGMSFSKLIESGLLKQKDLITKLGKSKQYVSALLSFSKIPQSIQDAVGDMTRLSARTAEEIKQLSNKGDKYINAIIELAPKLREGKLGQKLLKDKVMKLVNSESSHQQETKKYIRSGRHLLTLRRDNNLKPSLHLPKPIIDHLINNDVSIEELGEEIAMLIQSKF